MSCAHSDGWYAVESEWRDGDSPSVSMNPGRGEWAIVIVGRCRIFAPNFGDGIECAEGLIVELRPSMLRYGLYWAKPSRTFQLVPLRAAP